MSLPTRVLKEIQRLVNDPVPGISASPHQDNLRYFDVIIAGPSASPYEGGTFKLELFLTEEYPMAPPKVICSPLSKAFTVAATSEFYPLFT